MANTYVDYTATAAQTDFAFTFPYLEDAHVVVEIDGVQKTLTTDYTISTSPSTKIVLTSGATAGQIVRVRRKSQPDTDLVDFVNGSVLTETELDRAYLHNRYLNEEIQELNDISLQKEVGGTDWDADNAKIKNVGTPTLTADATTKQYVDDKVNQVSSGASSPPTKWVFTGTAGAGTTYSVTDAEVSGDTAYDVSIDGAVKEPTTDYTVDPDTDTLTIVGTLAGGEDIVVIERGFGVAITGTIGSSQLQSNAVTTAKIAADAVDGTKIADDSINSEHYVDGSIDSTHINTTDPVFNVQTSGDVGIGTATPTAKLQVETSDNTTIFDPTDTNPPLLEHYLAALRNVYTGGNVAGTFAGIQFNVKGGDSTQNAIGAINLVVEQNDERKAALTFTPSSATTIRPEAMRIDSSGNVGIGTNSPSAPLEVTSTTGGVIMPRMTTAQRNAISSPTNGEMIYNTTDHKFQGRANGAWVDLH